MIALRALAWLGAASLAALATPAAAEWRSVDTGGQGLSAEIRNDQGARVRISMGPGEQVFAAFQLPSGLATLDPQGCPTFQIDEQPAENLADGSHACEVQVNGSRVRLARVADGRVRSPTLQQLMNGSELIVRFRLRHAGYGAARFTLLRSKQALTDVLGESTQVVEE